MKKLFNILLTITFITSVFSFVCCNKFFDNDETKVTDGLCLNIGDKTIVYTSDIDFYDISSHTVYLKKKIEYDGIISVNVGEEEIYKCSIHPTYSSSLPEGVFIWGSPFMKEDIISFGFVQYLNEKHEPINTDPRNDKRIIKALKKYGQYCEGINCEIKSISYSKGKLVLNIDLYNPDTFNYYYLDIDKMGIGLFHYYTNGPSFLNDSYTKSYSHQETVIEPEPWDSWKKEWLSLLKSGERKNVLITYSKFEIIPAGKYRMFFAYPGLSPAKSHKELVLENGRIWVGGVCIEKEITIY